MSATLSPQMRPSLAALNAVLQRLDVGSNIDNVGDRKRLQKAIYLAQRFGIDLGYRYGWYLKGPYSPSLSRDYYALAEALEVGETADSRVEPDQEAALRRASEMFNSTANPGLKRENWLELLASIHYLKKVSKKDEADVMRVFREQKPDLEQFVSAGEQVLAQYGLL